MILLDTNMLIYGFDPVENRRKQTAPAAPKSPLPDFFIGAHASLLGLPLATADVCRYRTYFPEIQLITPPDASPL